MSKKLACLFALGVALSSCGIRAERGSSSAPYTAPQGTPRTSSNSTGDSTGNTKQRAVLLKWSDPITEQNLGEVPDPSIAGKSLAEIVGSYKSGRSDNMLCSSCHNQAESPKGYGVLVAVGGKGDIKSDQKVGSPAQIWGEDGGWTDKFATNVTKPASLVKAFLAWKASGYPP